MEGGGAKGGIEGERGEEKKEEEKTEVLGRKSRNTWAETGESDKTGILPQSKEYKLSDTLLN